MEWQFHSHRSEGTAGGQRGQQEQAGRCRWPCPACFAHCSPEPGWEELIPPAHCRQSPQTCIPGIAEGPTPSHERAGSTRDPGAFQHPTCHRVLLQKGCSSVCTAPAPPAPARPASAPGQGLTDSASLQEKRGHLPGGDAGEQAMCCCVQNKKLTLLPPPWLQAGGQLCAGVISKQCQYLLLLGTHAASRQQLTFCFSGYVSYQALAAVGDNNDVACA